jgi:tryptophan halogenase
MPGDSFDSWRRWLPCDRVLAASAPKLDPLPAFSQVSAFRSGWIGLYPLQSRTAVVAAYDSGDFSDSDMRESLGILSGLRIGGEGFVAPLKVGARPRPWIGNCIALGEAAVVLEPLDAVQLHLVHVGLSHLITLFPVDAEDLAEAETFNSGVASHARNLRDFQIAHYALNKRFDEAFWDRVRDLGGPDGLRAKIDLFASRGQVPLYDDETFQEQNWTSIFVGHGLIPRSYDPRIDVLPAEEHFAKVQMRLRDVAADVLAMPTIDDYLQTCRPEGPNEDIGEP